MVSEVWTAVRREEKEQGMCIIFEVEDETTGILREETRYEVAVLLMMTLGGGYSSVMAGVMLMMSLPWRFRKVGSSICIDGPSVGANDYHPIIDKGAGETVN